jgi:mitogen-activated protein kinase kinase
LLVVLNPLSSVLFLKACFVDFLVLGYSKMATSTPNIRPNIRTKRNFKGLQLSVSESAPTTAKEQEPLATRLAPAPVAPAASAPVGGKRRPPPMVIKAPKIPSHNGAMSAVEQDSCNLLTVSNSINPPHSASHAIKRNTYHATLSNTLASLDLKAEIKFDLKEDDLKDLQELGQGNGGSVKKVEHIPTKTIMAKKVRFHDTPSSLPLVCPGSFV